jgi:hypothetical protein
MPRTGKIENLKPPVRTTEEARERGRNGGIKSGEARREKKLMTDDLVRRLGKCIGDVNDALILQMKKGNVQAWIAARDTLGEKPKDKMELSGEIDTGAPIKLNILLDGKKIKTRWDKNGHNDSADS